jgi:hypothetical protein
MLYIQRNGQGLVVLVCPVLMPATIYSSWAEYGRADYAGNGLFLTEDYYMEIQGMA